MYKFFNSLLFISTITLSGFSTVHAETIETKKKQDDSKNEKSENSEPKIDTDIYSDMNVILVIRDFETYSVDEDNISFHAGFEYTEGKYNTPNLSKMTYFPVSAKYESGPWGFRVSSGYISASGDKNIIPGTGIAFLTDIEDIRPDAKNDKGISDSFISISYSFEKLKLDNVFIDLTTRVKIPTGDVDKRLSTGKADLSFQFDFAKLIGDFLPFATIGYRFVGKTDRYHLQNTWYSSFGIAYYATNNLSLGLSYDIRKSITPGYTEPQEVQIFVDYEFDNEWGINIYALTGLNDNSLDKGAGLQVRYKY